MRAGIAESPDKSEFTSVKERFDYDKKVAQAARIKTRRRLKPKRADDWLTPVELDERKRIGACVNRTGAGASDKGFLPMSLRDYLQLVDCTGCQIRRGKLGRFPIELVLSWNVSVLTEKFGVTSYLILVGSSAVSLGGRKRFRPKQRSDRPVGYKFQS